MRRSRLPDPTHRSSLSIFHGVARWPASTNFAKHRYKSFDNASGPGRQYTCGRGTRKTMEKGKNGWLEGGRGASLWKFGETPAAGLGRWKARINNAARSPTCRVTRLIWANCKNYPRPSVIQANFLTWTLLVIHCSEYSPLEIEYFDQMEYDWNKKRKINFYSITNSLMPGKGSISEKFFGLSWGFNSRKILFQFNSFQNVVAQFAQTWRTLSECGNRLLLLGTQWNGYISCKLTVSGRDVSRYKRTKLDYTIQTGTSQRTDLISSTNAEYFEFHGNSDICKEMSSQVYNLLQCVQVRLLFQSNVTLSVLSTYITDSWIIIGGITECCYSNVKEILLISWNIP